MTSFREWKEQEKKPSEDSSQFSQCSAFPTMKRISWFFLMKNRYATC